MFNIPTLSQVNLIPLPVPSPDGTFICDSITEPVIIKREKVDVEQDTVSPEKKLFFSPTKFVIPHDSWCHSDVILACNVILF